MQKKRPVSLIIPFHEFNNLLNDILRSIYNWSEYPSEILIVDNSLKKCKLDLRYVNFLKNKKIKIFVYRLKNSFPGQARNYAIKKSSYKILCFLDISTHAKNFWFEENYKLIKKKNIDIVYGRTFFLANSYFEKLLRISIYGSKPVRTLPGSFIKKKIFRKINLFQSNVRAGEDGQFFFENLKKKINFLLSNNTIIYRGLLNQNFFDIIKKWLRNYSSIASNNLQYIKKQKILYLGLLFSSFSLLIFAQNKLDVILFFMLIFYFCSRSLLLPFARSRRKDFLFIMANSPIIFIITLILDMIKSYSFLKNIFLYKTCKSQ